MSKPGWDVEERRLLSPGRWLGLPIPAYDGRSLPNVAVTLTPKRVRLRSKSAPPLGPGLARSVDPFHGKPPPTPTTLLVVDGFGWRSFRRWVEGRRSPRARLWGNLARPITSTFPSTTTTALFSLSTGTPVGRHGVAGFHMWWPRWGLVADMIRMAPVGIAGHDLLSGRDGPPPGVSTVPSLFRRGLGAWVISRDRYEGTGFTRLLYDGAIFRPYVTASDFAHRIVETLSRRRPPEVAYAYWDELDTVHHVRGPRQSLFDLEMERIAQLISHISAAVPRRVREAGVLLVTGDHGQVPTDPGHAIRLEKHPEILKELARPPGGERRAVYLTARSGRIHALRRTLEAALPRGTHILDTVAAIQMGLFGPRPHHPELSDRVGDLIVLPPVPAGITYRPEGGGPARPYLEGGHGGVEAEEFLVPLVAGRWEEFGDAD